MPNSPTRRTRKSTSGSQPPSPSPSPSNREPRGARRKRETRARLLAAALELMAERGMEGVAINEITEAADVGFGSFYNHFDSKESIYAALVEAVFEEFADALDRAVSGISDPAEVIAISLRHTLVRALREPLWGQFLCREGLSIRGVQGNRGLGLRLLKDFQTGIAAKRFSVHDPLMSFIVAGGTVLASIAAQLQLNAPGAAQSSAWRELGFSPEKFPERTAAAVLQTFGIGRAEAEKIAHRPLPAVEWRAAAQALDVPSEPAPSRAFQSGASTGKRGRRKGATA